MINIITKLSAVDINESFNDCLMMFGFETKITSESEDSFNTTLLYANIPEMSNLVSSYLSDSSSTSPLAYSLHNPLKTGTKLSIMTTKKDYLYEVIEVKQDKEVYILELEEI